MSTYHNFFVDFPAKNFWIFVKCYRKCSDIKLGIGKAEKMANCWILKFQQIRRESFSHQERNKGKKSAKKIPEWLIHEAKPEFQIKVS